MKHKLLHNASAPSRAPCITAENLVVSLDSKLTPRRLKDYTIESGSRGRTHSLGFLVLTMIAISLSVLLPLGVGFAQTGISGLKFNDLNANGVRDAGELGLANWTIKAQPDSSAPNPNPISVTTNADGEYSFTGLPDGHYVVSEVQQSGWNQTFPPSGGYSVQITNGVGAAGLDFGNTLSALPGSIYGYKFHDINGDGIRDSVGVQLEPLLDGWTIQISGPVTETTVTSLGYFRFSNLPPGIYTVSEVLQSRWIQTVPTNPSTYTVNLGSGQNVQVAFGNRGTNSIEGKKFNDINGNCVQDPGESGLPGSKIRLEPGPLYAITNADGKYTFASLGPGTYTIASDLNRFWGQTCPGTPGTYSITVDSGEVITGQDFGNRIEQYVQDLAVTAATYVEYPMTTPCCQQDMTYQISYSNLGYLSVSNATISVILSHWAEYVETTWSDPPLNPPTITVVGNHQELTYHIPTVDFNKPGTIHVKVHLTCCPPPPPDAPCDEPEIVTEISIESIDPDFNSTDNSFHAMVKPTCSHDPNDMAVSPHGCGVEGYITKNDVLTYTIRFQNLGTGPAHQVVIHDVLHSNLDIATVTNLGSSHPNVFEVNGNELVWTFPGIVLPPALTNEPGSHGYIMFRVNQKPNNPDGTVIQNLAAVYFDLNAPILTNMTINTITSNPLPVASFTITPSASPPCTYSFTYTGGTLGASFLWDFGSYALPQTSTDQNPTNVTYTQPGLKVITLQVTLGDCSSEPTVATLSVIGTGTITGSVLVGSAGLPNVTVRLLDNAMMPVSDIVTGSNGEYTFANIIPGTYNVMIVEPLGYAVDGNPKETTLNAGGTNQVNFTLTPVTITNNGRGIGYWKQQFDKYITNKGNAQETQAQLNQYIVRVHQCYTPHFNVFSGLTTFSQWQAVLSPSNHASMMDKARQQLAAFVMNFTSLKIGQSVVVTADGRTAGDVLTYVSILVTGGDASKYELAKDLAEQVCSQQVIVAGVVPEGNVLYKGGTGQQVNWAFDVPAEFSLGQNYPNPFNPSTLIEFALPKASHVTLKVFDVLGKEVATLINQELGPGYFTARWEANVPSGIYIYRLQAGEFIDTKKMVLLH